MSHQSERSFSFCSSIPVVRMLDEGKARAFYLDYLGFEIDWEHRFNDESTSPLYMQVRQGEALLHLNGHADHQSPTCEVRIPVIGLENYCQYLREKNAGFVDPEIVDPRYEGRLSDMNIADPFGNMLVFWAPDNSNS